MWNKNRWRATAVQDAGALHDDSRTARSVLECASPLALWDRARGKRETVGKVERGRRGRVAAERKIYVCNSKISTYYPTYLSYGLISKPYYTTHLSYGLMSKH